MKTALRACFLIAFVVSSAVTLTGQVLLPVDYKSGLPAAQNQVTMTLVLGEGGHTLELWGTRFAQCEGENQVVLSLWYQETPGAAKVNFLGRLTEVLDLQGIRLRTPTRLHVFSHALPSFPKGKYWVEFGTLSIGGSCAAQVETPTIFVGGITEVSYVTWAPRVEIRSLEMGTFLLPGRTRVTVYQLQPTLFGDQLALVQGEVIRVAGDGTALISVTGVFYPNVPFKINFLSLDTGYSTTCDTSQVETCLP